MKLFAAIAAVLFSAPALACAPVEGDRELVAEVPEPLRAFARLSPMTVSQTFVMQLAFCGEEAEAVKRVSIDAIMPAHQHGMNYTPVVNPSTDGQFSVSGMVFHMPGSWQVQVTVFGEGEPRFFTLDVEIK